MRYIQPSILLLICLTILSASFVAAQDSLSGDLFIINVNGKKGFIDKTGKVMIEPRFEQAEDFSEGLAAVKIGDWWGYIDTKGAVVIEPKFGAAHTFSEGMVVSTLNRDFDRASNQWILLDKSGKYVELPQVKDIGSQFSEGLIAAKNNQEKWGYLDKTGKVIIPFKFDRAASFAEGLAYVLLEDKFGYINRRGNFVIAPRFTEVKDFSNGVAAVKVGGQLILGEGIEIVTEEENKARWHLIGKNGKFVAKLRDDVVGAGIFSENLTWLQIKDKKDSTTYRFGFIDKSGKFVISPQYHDANNFSEGLARVCLNGKLGDPSLIDKSGKVVYSATNVTLGDFRNGLARIQEGFSGMESFDDERKQGYINIKGQFIWQPTK
jgi:hypothetical protein